MEVIFDEKDLEPLEPAPDPKEGKAREPSKEALQPSLFDDLIPGVELEPLMPGPDAWNFGTPPLPVPELESLPPKPSPIAGAAPSDSMRPEATAREPFPAPRMIRSVGDIQGELSRTRDDGLFVEVNADTCNDPGLLKRQRRGARPKKKVSLTARIVGALALREYGRKELRRKFARKLEEGETLEMLDAVLDRMEQLGYLSDERYACVKARSVSSRMGNARIERELRMRGIDSAIARKAVAEIEVPEEVRAYRIWRRRFDELPKDYRERERQIRYLAYRGFSFTSIQRVIHGEVEDSDEE